MKVTNYEEYLKSEYWQNIKTQVLERDKHHCRICNSQERLEVHHRTYEYVGNERLEELVTLCHECHFAFHKKKNISYKEYSERKNRTKEEDRFWKIIKDNINIFESLKKNICINNYMFYSDYKKAVLKVCNNKKFLDFVIKHSLFAYIESYTQEASILYGFPKKPEHGRCKCILILEKIYDKNPEVFSRVYIL